LLYLLEAARGRPLSRRAQEYSLKLGLTVVAALMLFVTVNDIRQLFSA
jgi:regulator of sigma E protease